MSQKGPSEEERRKQDQELLESLRKVQSYINGFSSSIQSKKDWKFKILQPDIAQSYIADAVRNGMEKEDATRVVRYLQSSAVEDDRIKMKDDIDPNLGRELEIELDKIANSPKKDFHPNTDGKIQDLIHPSLYPYVHNKTKLKFTSREKSANYLKMDGFDFLKRPVEVSEYQWLPSIFYHEYDTDTEIRSYINNLDPSHKKLYELIGKVFSCAFPLFEECLSRYDMAYTDLQVIVKAANYVIPPDGYYSGNWHVEGMSHEQIVASAIYYYSSSEHIYDEGLAFRRQRDIKEDYPQFGQYDNDHNKPSEGTRGWQMNVEMGAIPTTQGRMIVFPNDIQHRVVGVGNSSDTEIATRKILCFFLVNPDVNLISTMDVPQQQWESVKYTQAVWLTLVSKRMGKQLPKEMVMYIIEKAKYGFTWEEALQHRLNLMKERKFFVNDQNEEMEREYSLCEH